MDRQLKRGGVNISIFLQMKDSAWMRIESLEDPEDIILPSLGFLPEFIELISTHETHFVSTQETGQFFRNIFHMTSFRKGKMNMGAYNDQDFLVFFFSFSNSNALRSFGWFVSASPSLIRISTPKVFWVFGILTTRSIEW